MVFAASPGTEMPVNQAKRRPPLVPWDGLDTAQYGRVRPNEWPNGQLRHDLERRRVAPVTIESATGAPRGCASVCRRARRRRPAAAADDVSLRRPGASLLGS